MAIATKTRSRSRRNATLLDPSLMMEDLGFDPDPWQRAVLRSGARRLSMLCTRQGGKSTVASILGLHPILTRDEALVLLVSPSQRQSTLLFRKVKWAYRRLGRPIKAVVENATSLELENGSQIVSLPSNPDTIRGFSRPDLVILDEGAMVLDPTFAAVTPMLAVSPDGRLVTLSTPMGKRGWFHSEWEDPAATWERHRITAEECPRIDRAFLAEQKRMLGDRWFRQEYHCSFESAVDQVFSTESIVEAFDSGTKGLHALFAGVP